MGKNVPKSPSEPDISVHGCRRKVATLCVKTRRRCWSSPLMFEGVIPEIYNFDMLILMDIGASRSMVMGQEKSISILGFLG